MDQTERRRKYAERIEDYRNRSIDLFYVSANKTMDLGTDRMLKDCELYITLFSLLIAGLSFLYSTVVSNDVSKSIFIITFVVILSGVIRSFILKSKISRNIERYYKNHAMMMEKEIKELDYDDIPDDAHELFNKHLREQGRLLAIREKKQQELKETYETTEKWYLQQKNIIFAMIIVSSLLLITLLIIS